MTEVGLLVEGGLLETERVDDIDHGLGVLLDSLISILS